MSLPSTHASLFLALHDEGPRQQAWASLHARYHEVILTWCRRRGLSHAAAEDLAQEIWLRLFKDLHRYDRAKGRFRGWLKAVVNNALTDFWRRQRGRPESDGVGGTAFVQRLAAVAGQEDVEELGGAIERQANTAAAEMLARVRLRLHEATWLAFYRTLVEDRPAKEVAQELGLSVATVYKHTYRVKQMLHEENLHVHSSDHGDVVSESALADAAP